MATTTSTSSLTLAQVVAQLRKRLNTGQSDMSLNLLLARVAREVAEQLQAQPPAGWVQNIQAMRRYLQEDAKAPTTTMLVARPHGADLQMAQWWRESWLLALLTRQILIDHVKGRLRIQSVFDVRLLEPVLGLPVTLDIVETSSTTTSSANPQPPESSSTAPTGAAPSDPSTSSSTSSPEVEPSDVEGPKVTIVDRTLLAAVVRYLQDWTDQQLVSRTLEAVELLMVNPQPSQLGFTLEERTVVSASGISFKLSAQRATLLQLLIESPQLRVSHDELKNAGIPNPKNTLYSLRKKFKKHRVPLPLIRNKKAYVDMILSSPTADRAVTLCGPSGSRAPNHQGCDERGPRRTVGREVGSISARVVRKRA